MRILAVCQNFWPEPFNVDEMCSVLVAGGHEVTVLTGVPNYPNGDVPEEYRKGQNRRQNREGMRIYRVPTIPRGPDLNGVVNKLKRIANYASFAFCGCAASNKLGKFDLVIAFEFSPISMVYPAIKLARNQDIPLLIYVIDLWPEDVLAAGISKDGFIFRFLKSISANVYAKANRLAVTSPRFIDYVSKLVPEHAPFHYLPQYAEREFEAMPVSVPEIEGEFRLVFAGNIGANQALEEAIAAVAAMPKRSRLRLHIYGSGSREEACRQVVDSVDARDRVVFHGRLPLTEMPKVYASAHAMLLSLSASRGKSLVTEFTIPRKLQSYMAAGKPIVAFADGAASEVVDDANCGLSVQGGSPELLTEALIKLEKTPRSVLVHYAENAKRYYRENYSKEIFIERILGIVDEMVGQND